MKIFKNGLLISLLIAILALINIFVEIKREKYQSQINQENKEINESFSNIIYNSASSASDGTAATFNLVALVGCRSNLWEKCDDIGLSKDVENTKKAFDDKVIEGNKKFILFIDEKIKKEEKINLFQKNVDIWKSIFNWLSFIIALLGIILLFIKKQGNN